MVENENLEIKNTSQIEFTRQLMLEEERKKDKLFIVPVIWACVLAVACILFTLDGMGVFGENVHLPLVGDNGRFKYLNYNIGPINCYWFFMLLGFLFTIVSAFLRGRKYRLNLGSALILPLVFFLESFLGGKILFGIEKAVENGTFKNFSMAGQSLYGSLYMTLPVMPIFALLYKKGIRDMYDLVSPFWLILLAFVRHGCFSAGCCGSMMFEANMHTFYLPVQLFDSICSLLLLALTLIAESKETHMIFGLKPFTIVLCGYSFCRFFLEFIRTNQPLFYKLTMSQYHCILFFVIGIIFIIYDNNPKHIRQYKTIL